MCMGKYSVKIKCSFLTLLIFCSLTVQAQNEVRFTELKGSSIVLSQAIGAIKNSLISRNYIPKEFFATVRDNAEVYIFVLIHQDTYLPENVNVVGNPSGKDHECRYHKLNKEIISCLYYQ